MDQQKLETLLDVIEAKLWGLDDLKDVLILLREEMEQRDPECGSAKKDSGATNVEAS